MGMIRDIVKDVDNKGVALDDQHLAVIDSQIHVLTHKRAKLNASLRKSRQMRQVIIDRRILTDTQV